MSIVRMKRLRLVAVKQQRDELVNKLMLLGCVEINREELPVEGDELFGILSREDGEQSQRRSEYDSLIKGVSILDKYLPKKTPLLSAKPEVHLEELMDDTKVEDCIELSRRLDEAEDKIKRIEAEESHIRSMEETLKPWEKLDVPFDTVETQTCFFSFGTVPLGCAREHLEKELANENCEAEVFEVSSDADVRYILVAAMKKDRQQVGEILRSCGFATSSVGELRGTASENLATLSARTKELIVKKREVTADIVSAAKYRNELKLSADRLLTKTEMAENEERFLCTSSSFTFDGWIPADREDELAELFSNYDCAWETQEPDPEKPEEVPIKLKSNSMTRPFTMVTEMYSLPSYNGVDPNPFIFPSFAMFFGIMFCDMGYGLLLILAGLLMKYKKKATGTAAYLGGISFICGIGSFVFGAITGTFFGDIVPQVANFFGGSAQLPSLIDPLQNPMNILIICIGIGIVHMLIGVTINGYMLIRDGKVADALCDAGTVYLTFAGIALGVMGITWWVAIAGVASIVLTAGRESKSIVGRLGGGLWGLYNFATGWFGDILSYSRIMALMLAGSVIAQVFNTLGAMSGKIIVFVLVFLVGHALNFGLNIISTYVHTSRLEYLEFFGKFYREGGRAFAPLEIKTNYYNIVNN